jgi:hypothetical protein
MTLAYFDKNVFDVLKAKYLAEKDIAKVNLSILHNKAVGIGEHSDIVSEVDKWIKIIADADDKLAVLEKQMPLTAEKYSEYE